MCGDCLLDSQRLAPFCGAGEELCGHSAAAGELSSALFPDPPASRRGQPDGRAGPRVELRPPDCRDDQLVCEERQRGLSSEERGVGKAGGSTCKSRGWPNNKKKNETKKKHS